MNDVVYWAVVGTVAMVAVAYGVWRTWRHPGIPSLPAQQRVAGRDLIPALPGWYLGTKAMDRWGELKPILEVLRSRQRTMSPAVVHVRAEGVVVAAAAVRGFLIPMERIDTVVGGTNADGDHPARVPPQQQDIYINWRHEQQELRTHLSARTEQGAREWVTAVHGLLAGRRPSPNEGE
ncbi:hypothetical protein RIF23_04075 [Lipingzhangella sp. LS1_29]|uniref:PH domain-containing protein n=1 Tax=Lipingzhangella rawalii TaxID=2055835 RepID=A0ABU2H2E8_9ACTN|nr:hypothetical protein [Lipingzhangella rawalii]MDS1269471.1 hypothetical protein [Lipingzhangella rawalii]